MSAHLDVGLAGGVDEVRQSVKVEGLRLDQIVHNHWLAARPAGESNLVVFFPNHVAAARLHLVVAAVRDRRATAPLQRRVQVAQRVGTLHVVDVPDGRRRHPVW